MSTDSVEIVDCPQAHTARGLTLATRELPGEQRAALIAECCPDGPQQTSMAGLHIALRQGDLVGASWVQHQPGRTALFWPPQFEHAVSPDVARSLGQAAIAFADTEGVTMMQSLLVNRADRTIPLLQLLGFFHLADLEYMTCELTPNTLLTDGGPTPHQDSQLSLHPFHPSDHDRLAEIIRQTYQGTKDCPRLDGARAIGDVIAGYQAVGEFDPTNWLFARVDDRDIGILLLADHGPLRYWELMYMGVTPAARGQGRGLAIARQGIELARQAAADRLVLAVDRDNGPALAMYRQAGFAGWEKRTVYVRLAQGEPGRTPNPTQLH